MSGVKHTPELTLEQRAEAAGHVLRRDEDGEIDLFVLSEGYHNGPGCVVCDDSWCHHCDGKIEPCDGGKAKSERLAVERVRDAAPDLLEALQGLANALEVDPGPRGVMDLVPVALENARAAIARARGEQDGGGE